MYSLFAFMSLRSGSPSYLEASSYSFYVSLVNVMWFLTSQHVSKHA